MMRKRLEDLKARCSAACERAGRDPASVRILAVSKGHDISAIVEAYHLGVRDFGENYATEMTKKMEVLRSKCPEIRWHFVGQIQSNKMRLIATASWIHSLSELDHAQALSRFANDDLVHALVQVNLGEENHRAGVIVEELRERYASIKALPNINLCGLMTIAPLHEGIDAKTWFMKMRDIKRELEQKIGEPVPELSMGMSADFEDAIQYGATWIRVGTLIFGERELKPKH